MPTQWLVLEGSSPKSKVRNDERRPPWRTPSHPSQERRAPGSRRSEVLDVAAALEIAVLAGDPEAPALEAASPLADRLNALLTSLPAGPLALALPIRAQGGGCRGSKAIGRLACRHTRSAATARSAPHAIGAQRPGCAVVLRYGVLQVAAPGGLSTHCVFGVHWVNEMRALDLHLYQ